MVSRAEEAYFWLDEQYWMMRDAAEGAKGAERPASIPSKEQFRDALEFVWSRCLRLNAGSHGVRRLLVPFLDLANHESIPSAMYAYSHCATGGPAIRLHAARELRAGEPVTITYGEHSNDHFALYCAHCMCECSMCEASNDHFALYCVHCMCDDRRWSPHMRSTIHVLN